MSFDRRDIRKAMDVYTLDNTYLGSVLTITAGPAGAPEHVPSASSQASIVNGELLGPMPTQPIGNQASIKQGVHAQYDTAVDAEQLGGGAITVGRWWGFVGRRVIALEDVQTVSLERVVLKRGSVELG